MMTLDTLTNSTRPYKRRKRVGRGIGSKLGKTCGRGEKGAGSRSGYRRRLGKEGGNMPLFMKLPIRGFSNARFKRRLHVINLRQIDRAFEDGETVSVASLREKGIITGKTHGVKVLGDGELKKNLKLHVHALSDTAMEKLTQAKVVFQIEK